MGKVTLLGWEEKEEYMETNTVCTYFGPYEGRVIEEPLMMPN